MARRLDSLILGMISALTKNFFFFGTRLSESTNSYMVVMVVVGP